MTVVNGYTTLQSIKDLKIIGTDSVDATDDSVIESLIVGASRYIDGQTRRWFYPRVMTRLFDLPEDNHLDLDADLCEALTITNGDDTVVVATEYVTCPRSADDTPWWAVEIKYTSGVSWRYEDDGNPYGAIQVNGVWVYREFYASSGWLQLGTLTAALNATATTALGITGTVAKADQIIRIDNEFMQVATALTVTRGVNGSTAATHLINAPVYAWQPQGDIVQACQMIVDSTYRNRFGNNPTGTVRVTGAGVVISPQDVPALAASIIASRTRPGW